MTRYERAIEDQMSLIDHLTTPTSYNQTASMVEHARGSLSGSNMQSVMSMMSIALSAKEMEITGHLDIGLTGQWVGNHDLTLGELATKFSSRVRSQLLKASPFFVTSRMIEEWERIIDDHDLTRTIEPQMLMVDRGVATFERPLIVLDDEGHETPVTHVVWFPHPRDPHRVVTTWYADLRVEDVRRVSFVNYQQSEIIPEEVKGWDFETWGEFMRQANGNFVFDTWSIMPFDSDALPATTSPANRNFCYLMMLMAQPIAGGIGVQARDRWVRKAAKRRDLDSEINLIYLRKEVSRNPDLKEALGTGSKIKIRHAVRSHWQRYWVTSPNGEKRREWRKVSAYMRGPDTGPTRIKDELFVVKR